LTRAGRGIGNHLLQNSVGNQKLARLHVSDMITYSPWPGVSVYKTYR